MVLMLLDHVREAFLLWVPIGDPVDALTVACIFFSRMTSTLCAPIFVALTGLGAYLYGRKHSRAETSAFLFKRGALLVLLELTVVNFVGVPIPADDPVSSGHLGDRLSMIVLSLLIRLPHAAIVATGVAIVAGIIC
jgi:uncharacterized membrane protein